MDICKDFGGCFCVYTLYTMKALVNVPGLSECTLGDRSNFSAGPEIQVCIYICVVVIDPFIGLEVLYIM